VELDINEYQDFCSLLKRPLSTSKASFTNLVFVNIYLVFTKKASNFASKCELGRLPIISFITSLTFKYYSRLKELPSTTSTRLVKEAFEVDKGLFNSEQKSWYSFISNSTKKMNLPSSHLDAKLEAFFVNTK
jgi:hypothetical protein